ncbi:D-alanyl-D-alanine carboxypeptidase family protein [Salinibacterium hongtaonis]|uniref:D-alanyl-D-alanine carboxypeptidase family protein n=1 Tax=Homoserinimonas hongtaonis TaxID=2079791 RepID=UPI00131F3423|nr:D-alanyl-D-alanine carboxypeptidase [Salinibacterium hongtaonis]
MSGEFADLVDMFERAPDAHAVDPEAAAASRKRRRIAGIVAGATALALVTTASIYSVSALTSAIPLSTAHLTAPGVTPGPVAAMTLPVVGSSAIVVSGENDFEAFTGSREMVGALDADAARPIASISKVITALVVLDAKPLGIDEPGPTITFTAADDDLYDKYYVLGATTHTMKKGERMTQRDALEVMLVASASNYAEAVANWAFGSPAGFRNATKTWLAKNGLNATVVVEPTGIDPRNVSTPAELITLGRLAMADPVLAVIVQSPSLDVPGHSPVSNSNTLLGQGGVNGIKTGTLAPYGSNLLFSSVIDVGIGEPLTVTGATLGAFDRDSLSREIMTTLQSIKGGFRSIPLVDQGRVLGTYTTPWGDSASVVTGKAGTLLTWSDTPVTSEITSSSLGEGESGTVVGSITYTAGPRTSSVPLVLDGTIEPPSAWWRLTHPAEVFGW